MATSCITVHHCSTQFPGWYKGPKPGVLDKEMTSGEGCFSSAKSISDSSACCDDKYGPVTIKVRNCGRFTVWKLPKVIGCKTRYCGNGTLRYYVAVALYRKGKFS